MIIKNKIESMQLINELGLNKYPEQLFNKNVGINKEKIIVYELRTNY